MGREIKLRVWDKEDKKFLEPCFESEEDRFNKGMAMIRWNSEGKIWFTLSGYRDDDGNPYQIDAEVMEYTGLKDKNGKEIYAGDIVRFKHEKLVEKEHEDWDLPYDFETNEYYRNYVVEFTNTNTHYGLRLRNKNIWFMIHKMTLLTHDAIVISNIYDNPELLQEVDK